jgi:CRP-like cAMP-binding protein
LDEIFIDFPKKHPLEHHGIPIQADYFYIVQQGSFAVSKAEGDGKEGTSNSTPPFSKRKI